MASAVCQAAVGAAWRGVACTGGDCVGVVAGVPRASVPGGTAGVVVTAGKVEPGRAGGEGCSSLEAGVETRGRTGVTVGTVCASGPTCGAAQTIGPALTASVHRVTVSRHNVGHVRSRCLTSHLPGGTGLRSPGRHLAPGDTPGLRHPVQSPRALSSTGAPLEAGVR
jgi:hypothetical protein